MNRPAINRNAPSAPARTSEVSNSRRMYTLIHDPVASARPKPAACCTKHHHELPLRSASRIEPGTTMRETVGASQAYTTSTARSSVLDATNAPRQPPNASASGGMSWRPIALPSG